MALYIYKNNKKMLITSNVVNRKNIFRKGFGLMFHKKILNEAHIFYFKKPQKLALTMFFVFFPIDVVFLKDNVVVELKKDFKPFTNYTSKEKANVFIELPNGFINKNKIVLDSKLEY